MTDQSNAAAERSAHVERGPARRIPGESFLVEVTPGVFKLKAVVEAERERDAARADAERLREALERLCRNQHAPGSLADSFWKAREALAGMEPGYE